MELSEKTITVNEVFPGRLIKVYRDDVELPNGDKTTREVVRHPGGATVCAIDKDLNVTMVRQFRYAYAESVLELPAGKLEKGEDPSAAAKRELHEETGLVADELLPLGIMYPSPGYTDEIIYMYLAIHVEQDEQKLDKDEFVNVEKIPFGEAIQMVMQGGIADGKSQVALLKSYLILDQLNQQAQAVMAAEEAGGSAPEPEA